MLRPDDFELRLYFVDDEFDSNSIRKGKETRDSLFDQIADAHL